MNVKAVTVNSVPTHGDFTIQHPQGLHTQSSTPPIGAVPPSDLLFDDEASWCQWLKRLDDTNAKCGGMSEEE